jgi:hypothetical protein
MWDSGITCNHQIMVGRRFVSSYYRILHGILDLLGGSDHIFWYIEDVMYLVVFDL